MKKFTGLALTVLLAGSALFESCAIKSSCGQTKRGMKGQKRAFYEAHIQKPKEYQELANAYEINIPYTPKYAVSN